MGTSNAENQVLLYIVKDGKVLLIEKKRGLGSGLINGLGGKVEENETIEQAVIREAKEEAGITPKDLKKKATLFFTNNENKHIIVHVFVAYDYEGEPIETEEAKPFWQSINEIPYDKMWEDDIYWLPYVISGLYVYGEFKFKDWKMISKQVYVSSEKLSVLLQYFNDKATYHHSFKENNIKEHLTEILNAYNLKDSKSLKEVVDYWFKAKHQEKKHSNIETKLRDETKKWLFKLKSLRLTPISKKSNEIIKNIEAYIKDAEHFLKNEMLIEAFEAVIWAWSWAEISERLEVLKVE